MNFAKSFVKYKYPTATVHMLLHSSVLTLRLRVSCYTEASRAINHYSIMFENINNYMPNNINL